MQFYESTDAETEAITHVLNDLSPWQLTREGILPLQQLLMQWRRSNVSRIRVTSWTRFKLTDRKAIAQSLELQPF